MENGFYNKNLGGFKNEVYPGKIIKFASPGPKMKVYWVKYPFPGIEIMTKITEAMKEWDDPLKRRKWKRELKEYAEWPGKKWFEDDIHSLIEVKANLKGYGGNDADEMLWKIIKDFTATGHHTKWSRTYNAVRTVENVEYTCTEESILSYDTRLQVVYDGQRKELFILKHLTLIPERNLDVIRDQWKRAIQKFEELYDKFFA
jgi:hypothetical protein